ncbi:tetratricopeptide repeat protein, partial [Singulisphaera rosea]
DVDPRELSWGVLAHVIRETRFVQVYRRLSFLHDTLGGPVGTYWATARRSVERHPNLPFLEVFVRPHVDVIPSLTDFVGRLDRTNLEATARPMIRRMEDLHVPNASDLRGFATSHADSVARDLALELERGSNEATVAKNLLEVDPRSSFAMASLVEEDWDGVKDRVPEWRKIVDDAPMLLAALATHYTATKELDEARNILMRYIARCPDSWGYLMLANNYRARGEQGRWKATLDEFLEKVEDRGHDHASIRVKIAEEFMRQKRWADALPYAETAAGSWAPWAMTCAAQCAEGMEDWPRAELWLRRSSEHHPGAWADWYRSCLRTGHGDVKSARVQAERSLAEIEGRRDVVDPKSAAYFYWSTGSLRKAQGALTRLGAENPVESSTILHLALIADEMDEPRRRDELLETIWTKYQGQAPRTAQVCRVLRRWLADGGQGEPLDQAFLDKQLDRLAPKSRGDLEFFVGRFLVLHDKPEIGRPYLRRCNAEPAADEWIRAIARQSLRMSALAPLP